MNSLGHCFSSFSRSRSAAILRVIAGAAALCLTASAGQFSYRPWTNDGDCGLSPLFSYTCAVNLNGAASNFVNTVLFTGQSGMPASGTGYSLSGFAGSYTTDDANTVTGQSRELAKRFRFNGNPGTVTFTGLTEGKTYRATLFSVGWDPEGARTIVFACGTDSLSIDQNAYGNNNGIRIDYEYTAGASGSVTITATPTADYNPARSFHLYAFCNAEKLDGLYVDNKSFEWPVIAGNSGAWEYQSSIGGWTQEGGNFIGLTTNVGPWAGDAAFPDGRQVCFIQNSSSNTATLAQQLVNLTSGETYRVSYRYAARVGTSGQTTPTIKVSADDTVLQETMYAKNLGAGNPFYLGAHEFTATGTTARLLFANTRFGAGVDSAVLLDDIMIEPAGLPGWTIFPWTGDATAGVISNASYSHAINVGDSSATTISGVSFKGSGTGANPTEGAGGANYSVVAQSRFTTPESNNLTGGGDGSAILARLFCYHNVDAGGVESFTLNGLLPGQRYETTVYGVAWDDQPTSRSLAFSVNGSPEMTFNENMYGNNNGVRFRYLGTANSNGTITVEARLLYNNNSFHLYGFANRAELNDEIVLADTFAGQNGADNGKIISLRGADHRNVFLTGNYVETGINAAYRTDIQNGTVRFGPNAGAAIRIHDSDGHLKPAVMRLQADLNVGTLTGTDYIHGRGVGLGFYAQGEYADNLEVATGFSGLILAPDGDLYLFRHGAYAGDATRIPYGGLFTNTTFYTLSYEVNIDSGTIAGISLEGSTNDYSLIEAAASGFTRAHTEMLGILGSSSTAGKFGYLDNLILTELVPGVPPPEGTLILLR